MFQLTADTALGVPGAHVQGLVVPAPPLELALAPTQLLSTAETLVPEALLSHNLATHITAQVKKLIFLCLQFSSWIIVQSDQLSLSTKLNTLCMFHKYLLSLSPSNTNTVCTSSQVHVYSLSLREVLIMNVLKYSLYLFKIFGT